LLGAVQGIAELITRPGLINVDFADVRTVMAEMGMAMMGSGTAQGQDRAREAAEAAIASPLLEDVDIKGAAGILVNVTAGMDMSIGEFDEVGNTIKAFASDDATVVIGTVIDPEMSNELRVTLVATGLSASKRGAIEPKQELLQPSVRLVEKSKSEQVPEVPAAEDIQYAKQRVAAAGGAAAMAEELDMDLLDIPAFLRNQAD